MDLTTLAILDSARIVERRLELAMRAQGLSVAQLRILEEISARAEGLQPSQLGALLLQETHSVSGLLNRLEDRGLITRTRDRQDRRVIHACITALGRQMMAGAHLAIKPDVDDMKKALGLAEKGEELEIIDARNLLLKLVPKDVQETRKALRALAK